VCLAVFEAARQIGHSEEQSRALSFVTLVIGNIGLILSNRSWTLTIPQLIKQKNTALAWVLSGATVFLALAIILPFFKNLFKFGTLHLVDLAICILAGIVNIAIFEAIKFTRKKWFK
jgi:Ca2+-transporting ATPase